MSEHFSSIVPYRLSAFLSSIPLKGHPENSSPEAPPTSLKYASASYFFFSRLRGTHIHFSSHRARNFRAAMATTARKMHAANARADPRSCAHAVPRGGHHGVRAGHLLPPGTPVFTNTRDRIRICTFIDTRMYGPYIDSTYTHTCAHAEARFLLVRSSGRNTTAATGRDARGGSPYRTTPRRAAPGPDPARVASHLRSPRRSARA